MTTDDDQPTGADLAAAVEAVLAEVERHEERCDRRGDVGASAGSVVTRVRAVLDAHRPDRATQPTEAAHGGYCPPGCTWSHDHRFEADGKPWPTREQFRARTQPTAEPRTVETDEREVGLIDKYVVRRQNDPNGKHDDCRFFVLDPQHDALSVVALRSYAVAAEQAGCGPLAADIKAWLRSLDYCPSCPQVLGHRGRCTTTPARADDPTGGQR